MESQHHGHGHGLEVESLSVPKFKSGTQGNESESVGKDLPGQLQK